MAYDDAALLMWSTSSNFQRALRSSRAGASNTRRMQFGQDAPRPRPRVPQSARGLDLRHQGRIPGPQHQPSSVFTYERGRHSAKPLRSAKLSKRCIRTLTHRRDASCLRVIRWMVGLRMVLRPIQCVWLPSDIKCRCWRHGEEMVAMYERGDVPVPHRSRFPIRGVEFDARKQTEAKMAECVFAIKRNGLDPRVYEIGTRSQTNTMPSVNKLRCDVKGAPMFCRYLIWSKAKNHIFESKGFDVLVLVKVNVDKGWGYSQGWCTKREFREKKSIAGKGHRLDEDTWHLDEDILREMPTLYRTTTRWDLERRRSHVQHYRMTK